MMFRSSHIRSCHTRGLSYRKKNQYIESSAKIFAPMEITTFFSGFFFPVCAVFDITQSITFMLNMILHIHANVRWWWHVELGWMIDVALGLRPTPTWSDHSDPFLAVLLERLDSSLLSCIVMFYSAPGEYWKILHYMKVATRANNPSLPSSLWQRPAQISSDPSNRTQLVLHMITESHRFHIHYSAVGMGGLKWT